MIFKIWRKRNSRPKKFRIFFFGKVNRKSKFQNFENFPKKIEILKFSFFIDFSEDFFSEKKMVSKNIFSAFSTNFFDLELFYFCVDFFLYQSEIFSGIQKSYLENRASIIKLFKIKNPLFYTNFSRFTCVYVWCYV